MTPAYTTPTGSSTHSSSTSSTMSSGSYASTPDADDTSEIELDIDGLGATRQDRPDKNTDIKKYDTLHGMVSKLMFEKDAIPSAQISTKNADGIREAAALNLMKAPSRHAKWLEG